MAEKVGLRGYRPSVLGQAFGSAAQKAAELLQSSSLDEVPAAHFEKHLRLTRPDVIETLKQLEAAGYGKLIYGRHGYETRFAKGGGRPELTDGVEGDPNVNVLIVRREPQFVMKLPVDLTRLEANRIIKWIEAVAEE